MATTTILNKRDDVVFAPSDLPVKVTGMQSMASKMWVPFLGMGFMMSLVAYGLGKLVLGSPQVLRALNWGGVALLLWLSWKIATAGRGPSTSKADPIGFFGAAAFQWINPKSWVVSASAAGTYLHADAGSAFAQSLTFGLLFIVAAAPCGLVWLAFGAGVQRFLRSEIALRVFNIALGAILAGSAIGFVW